MGRADIKNQILNRKERARFCTKYIQDQPEIKKEEFDQVFTEYFCAKLLLEICDINTDDFYELCQISVKKNGKLREEAVDEALIASKCGGATTAMSKKVLFLLAVNEEFQCQITSEQSIEIDTFTKLKETVYEALMKGRKKNA